MLSDAQIQETRRYHGDQRVHALCDEVLDLRCNLAEARAQANILASEVMALGKAEDTLKDELAEARAVIEAAEKYMWAEEYRNAVDAVCAPEEQVKAARDARHAAWDALVSTLAAQQEAQP